MKKPYQVTLDNCHEEPIHIPGSVQSHGMLLVIEPKTLTLRYFSENIATTLNIAPAELINTPMARLFNREFVEIVSKNRDLLDFYQINPVPVTLQIVQDNNLTMSAVLSHCQGLLMIELEHSQQAGIKSFEPVNYLIKHSLHSMVNAQELSSVFDSAVKEIRNLTGFDRVMLYQFDAEYNGEVVAEAKKDSLNSFLKQHFPESDIPKQARALYLKNPIRLLADVHASVSPIYPQDKPVDLSHCILRSVSPIHCQYLSNMGVKASMSISIIIGGKLWGLVACHHYSAHVVPFETREIAQYLGLMLSYLITLKTKANEAHKEAEVLSISATISERMSNEDYFLDGLRQETALLMKMLNATGLAWRVTDDLECFGETPENTEIESIVSWIKQHKLKGKSIYHSHHLGGEHADFVKYNHTSSGVLFMPISASGNQFLIWFRKEVIESKNWGGKPEKVIEFTDDGSHRLMPRSSFALWKENVRNKSQAWQNIEISSVLKFRNTVVNYVLVKSERLEKINNELEEKVKQRTEALEVEIASRKQTQHELRLALAKSEESNIELERFAFVASHDLQEPLRKIQTFGDRIQHSNETLSEKNASYLSRMMGSANRMQALIKGVLSFSRINQLSDKMEVFNADEALAEIIADLEILISEKNAKIEHTSIGEIYGGKRQIQRILQNLLQNALKFSKADVQAKITISLVDGESAYTTLAISDNGIGFDNSFNEKIFHLFERLHGKASYEGTGLGLAICKKIAERHLGKIWAESTPDVGTTFYLSLPKPSKAK